ncbi:MAG TPA: hypothetical protein VFA81_10795 [Burkholderiales bacterium]|nr:hypothetical protein [Burkholderiales bacterium]
MSDEQKFDKNGPAFCHHDNIAATCRYCADVTKAAEIAAERVIARLRAVLADCNICGGKVDMTNAKEPTVDWGGRKLHGF